MTLAHRMAAAAAICLPILGAAAGRPLGFTMYASSTWFLVTITAATDHGDRPVAPSAIAAKVVPSAARFLAGSDHLRRTYDVSPLRGHLDDVARLACEEAPGARAITITLVERKGSPTGPETSTTKRAGCIR